MYKKIVYHSLLFVIIFISVTVRAEIPQTFKEAFEARFTPAVFHRGLQTAASKIEMDKLRGFVVVEKDKVIPANRAEVIVEPADYDYLGAMVKNGSVKTRIGTPYIYLSKGTVMAVAGVVYSGRDVYIKLISMDILKSERYPKKTATRVTVMLGFKFPESVYMNGETDTVFNTIQEWVAPFQNLQEAEKYAGKN